MEWPPLSIRRLWVQVSAPTGQVPCGQNDTPTHVLAKYMLELVKSTDNTVRTTDLTEILFKRF